MRKTEFLWRFILAASLAPLFTLSAQTNPEVARLQAKIKKYQDCYADRRYGSGVRAGVDTFSILATLSEEALMHQAQKYQISASDLEAEMLLRPLLTQEGLIDPLLETGGLARSENVRRWLHGQHMTYEDLLKSGRQMVLWTKIATLQAPEPTSSEIKAFVDQHPQFRLMPARVQIEITTYVAPPLAGTRGLLVHQVLSPNLELGFRGSLTGDEAPPPADWQALELYLELETLDPNLRSVLSGKKEGDVFGPVKLKNGASLGGVVKKYLQQVDLSSNPGFWEMASLQVKLEKTASREKFEKIVQEYFDDSSPAVRGFWSSVFGGFKRCFKYIAGGVGGVVGLIAGGPQGMLTGARYGYQAGSMIQGFWSSKRAPAYSSDLLPVAVPGTFTQRPYPVNAPYRVPDYYYDGTILAMEPDYTPRYEQLYPGRRQMPPPPVWAPPLYLGASVWY